MCFYLYLPRISPTLTSVLPSLLPPSKDLKIPTWISPFLLDHQILSIWKQPTWYQHQMVLLPISVTWLSDKRRYLELLTSYPVKYILKCAFCIFCVFYCWGFGMHMSLSQIWLCVISTLTKVIDLAKDQFCKTTVFFVKINHTAVRPRVSYGHYSTSGRQRYWQLHNCKFFWTVNWFIQNVQKKSGRRYQ